jgi:putative ABC transport system substrate-binding protein
VRRRREIITLLGGAAVWPLGARAQDRARRVGVLFTWAENDPDGQARAAKFRSRLQALGWIEGRNLKIEWRWAAGEQARIRAYAAELIALAPEVIMTSGGSGLRPLFEQTRIIPIVFMNVNDPVGSGFVESLARPGGNVTGFTSFEFGLSGKWLEILKEVAPRVGRVNAIRDPTLASGPGFFGAIQAVAPALHVQVSSSSVRDGADFERVISTFAGEQDAGLILLPGPLLTVHLDRVIALAARHRMPAMYPYPYQVSRGGLVSYGIDLPTVAGEAAEYVARILSGEKAADLPIQAPNKFQLVINLTTAKALGLEVQPTLLARADEVIQ